MWLFEEAAATETAVAEQKELLPVLPLLELVEVASWVAKLV